MRKKLNQAGFAMIELPMVILILGLTLCIVGAFVAPLRQMARGQITLTTYEYFGTVIIYIGMNLGFFLLEIIGMLLVFLTATIISVVIDRIKNSFQKKYIKEDKPCEKN